MQILFGVLIHKYNNWPKIDCNYLRMEDTAFLYSFTILYQCSEIHHRKVKDTIVSSDSGLSRQHNKQCLHL